MARHVSAVIAAAGLSSRMGAFKPLLPFRGATVAEWAVRSAQAWGARQIYLVLGFRGQEIARRFQGQATVIPVWNLKYRESDMFLSIRLGLERAAPLGGSVFLLPGDLPAVDEQTGRRLLEALERTEALWGRPVWQGRGGHPVLLSSQAAALVRNYQGPDGLRGALRSLPEPPLEVPGGPEIRMDLDTPEDYQALRQREGDKQYAAVRNETI